MGNRAQIALVGLFMFLFAADAFAAVGRTVGQFAVSPTGSAQYSIPIWAPPGPHGVQPHIALTYDSQQGNGYVGVGWGVSGLSSIYRCNRTIAQDGVAAPIGLATSDGYCMDGKRLRLTGGTYGAASSTYQTEIANFVNVEAFGAAGNGPAYWQATDRNGLQYTYGGGGTTSNAEVLASGSTTADSWQLNEVKDPYGNTMTITYSTTNVTGLVVPKVISWVPASAGSSSYNYTMTFSYGTTGSVHGYVGGTPFNNTNILSSIAIAYEGTALKTYYLTYSNTTTATSRYLLTEVQECAGTGTSNCLAPTNVTWQAGAAGIGSGTAVSGTVGYVFSAAFDFNGDGRNDLLMITSTRAVYVAFGSSSGYGTPVATGLSSTGLAVGDIDGSGVAGILGNVSGTWYYYKWNGSAFVGASTGISVATAASPVLADLDGDGRADFAYTDSTGIVHVRLSTSTPGTVSFSTDINSGVGISNFTISAQTSGSNRALHFWGGAQADLLGTERTCAQYDAKGICIAYQYLYNALHFTGSTFSTAGLPSSIVDFADYNDDGCTDLLTATQLLLSACDGTAPIAVALPAGVAAVGGMDWNGDGRRDVLVAQSSGNLGVVLSTGTGLASTVINTSYSTSSLYYSAAPNLTGDGQDGLIGQNSAGTSATYYLHNDPGAPPDLLTSITDGYGNSAKPTYVPISESNYQQYSDATFPDQNYIGPMYVVGETIFSDPSGTPGVTYNNQYYFYDGWMNLQGRGFEGFGIIRTYDSRSGLYYYNYYERAFPYTGMLYTKYTLVDNATNGVFYSATAVGTPNTLTQATLSSTANEQRYFPYFTNWTVNQREVGGAENGDLITTTSANYTYDNYGNALTIDTTVTDSDPGSPYTTDTWTTNITNTPDVDTTHWCLGLLTETQAAYSASVGGAVTRTKTFTPDTTNCRYTQIVTEPTSNGGLYKVTEALTYDSFGNVATDTVTGATMPSSPASRETQFNWGTTGQFLNYIIDPSNAKTTWTYTSDPALTFGVPDSKIDPNTLTTSWGYDAFGRKTSEKRADGTSTGWGWSLCSLSCGWSNSVYQIAQTLYQTNGTTAIRTDTNSYDPIDRVTQTSGPTVTGSITNVQKLYNSLGLLVKQSMPFLSGATAYQQSFGYDVLNRLVESERPVNASSGQTYCNPATIPLPSGCQAASYAYAGRTTTVTDPLGHAKTTVTDVNGWLRHIKDATGYTVTRSYDSAGSLIGITDSASNTLLSNVTYNYGIQPFLVGATDADLGAWTYTVDSLGERTSWKDAKGQSFSMTYDALSRPLTRTESDLSTTWAWGSTPASHNVGKLQSVTSADSLGTYSDSYVYDSDSRVSTRTIAIPQDTSYVYTRTYSATTGLPDTLQYPVSTSSYQMKLQYAYQNGLLNEISDFVTGTHYWMANGENARGQYTQETFGNGVVVNHALDAVTGWVSSIQAGVGGGATLQNNSYLFDDMGNLTQRQDNNLGVTENAFPDSLNRLDHTVGDTNTQMSYDAIGRIATWAAYGNSTNVNNFTTPQSGCTYFTDHAQPHAVRQSTQGTGSPTSFCYDANGNLGTMTYAGATEISATWTTYNQPSGITEGTTSSQFFYNGNHQRYKQIASYSGSSETTYYVGGLLEKMINSSGTSYRHYIPAGTNTVIYTRQLSGANSTYYVTKDHLGSSAIVSDSTGTSLVSEKFSALGWNENTTPQQAIMATVSRHEYTGHEGLDNLGIVNMNGRVYWPSGAMFLSPDPHITDPTNTQNYNRYGYVNNNPLSFTDPSGFDPKTPCIASAGNTCGGAGAGVADNLDPIVVTASRFLTDDYGNSVQITVNITPGPSTAAQSNCLFCTSQLGDVASIAAPTFDLVNQIVQKDPALPPKAKVAVEIANNVVQGTAINNDANTNTAVQTTIAVTEAVLTTALPDTSPPVAIANSAFQTLNNYYTFAASAALSLAYALVEDANNLTF
jgi:RHS repeat-associated protein